MKKVTTREVLSEREERLLVRYFDGECGWFGRWSAGRLLSTNNAAREFMDTMHVIGEIARNERAGVLAENPQPVDLWDSIKSRIEAEERAALFLGRRGAEKPAVTGSAGFFSYDRLLWGTSGALAAACLTYFVVAAPGVFQPGVSGVQVAQISTPRDAGQPERVAVRRVVRSDSKLFSEPLKILEQEVPSTLEVDWVRSAGRVRMMQDPGERSAIIWVKRREPVNFASRRLPSAASAPLVVYNDRLPGSIPVSNR